MSSPVHHPKDLDAALMYAPPRVRNERARDEWFREEWARNDSARGAPVGPGALLGGAPKMRRAEAEEPAFVGDLAMLELQRRLALDPKEVPEPPLPLSDGPPYAGIALRLGGIATLAALAAWAMISLPAAEPAGRPALRAEIAPPGARAVKVIHLRAPAADPAPLALVVATVQPRPAVEDAQLEEPNAPGARVTLDPYEIANLVRRGKDYLENGDFSSARLLLRRAAEAGSAEAALALGATFDPLVIERLAAIGAEPDAGKARQWYRKAAALGSDVAEAQLAKLARTGQ